MKKKILPLLFLTLIITLINTGLLMFIVLKDAVNAYLNRPIVISRDYDKGQSMEKAIKKNKPVIALFYTDWCGYCQKFVPVFKEITNDKEIKKNFAIAYINAEDPSNFVYTAQYDIKGYPTLYLIDNIKDKKELVNPVDLFGYNAKENLKINFFEFLI